jgi:hypothetical protein
MQRRTPFALAALVPATLIVGGCAGPGSQAQPEPAGPRAVVLAGHPVALQSHQRDTVVWPIWGGAFTPDEPVTLRGRVRPGGDGASGLVIAGPGEPGSRVTVELVASDGGWSVRETDGSTVLQNEPVDGATSAELSIEITADRVAVSAGGALTTLELAEPLAGDGAAAGLYAYLEPAATLDLLELELSQPLPRHPELGTPLRDLAAERGIDIGSALDIWPPLHDLGFESMLGEQFSSATPTELYWSTTRGEDDGYFFVPADLSMNYATVHDLSVTAMFLVWDFELPQWVLDVAATGDAETLGDKSDFLFEMVSDLVARDVPIDAVGLQFHVDSANPPDMASARQNMQRFAELGLDVYITELDVMIAGTADDQLQRQAEIYADVVGACLEVSGCRNTTVFGFSDRYSWDELGEAAPLMFTEDYVAKPAFPAVQEALQR